MLFRSGFDLVLSNETNRTVHVADSYGGDLGTVTGVDDAPWATATFTYDRTESGVGGTCTAYDNKATITETEQSASKSVDLCVAEDPTVTKTAAGTFDRTYRWELSKEVDRTLAEQLGGTATFRYTVEVEQEGVTDSGWVVTGVITVVNPNDWQAITLTGLVDAVDNGGSCTVDDGPWVVPASGSLTVAYRCSYSTRDRKSTRLNSSH